MTEDLVAVLRSVTRSDDPVERIGQAAEILGQAVLRRQGAVRVLVASTIGKPATAKDRPAHRFGLIEHALAPWIDTCGSTRRADVEQLVRGLAIVISAESVFTLIDLCGLTPGAPCPVPRRRTPGSDVRRRGRPCGRPCGSMPLADPERKRSVLKSSGR
jgi:hypothetical protein